MIAWKNQSLHIERGVSVGSSDTGPLGRNGRDTMTDKFKHFDDWHVRKLDGTTLNLNTEEAADYMLSLIERVEALEARAKRTQRVRSRKKVQNDDDNGDA